VTESQFPLSAGCGDPVDGTGQVGWGRGIIKSRKRGYVDVITIIN
jgi:hypothetical protein